MNNVRATARLAKLVGHMTALLEYLTVLLECIDLSNLIGTGQPTFGWA